MDCTTASPDHAGESLRGYAMGGPAGASFNWYGAALVCTLQLTKACKGSGRARLHVGKATFDRAVTLSPRKETSVTIAVPAKTWGAALEPARDPFIYDRLLVVARVDAVCEEDEGGVTPYHRVDGFVGGFGGGE